MAVTTVGISTVLDNVPFIFKVSSLLSPPPFVAADWCMRAKGGEIHVPKVHVVELLIQIFSPQTVY